MKELYNQPEMEVTHFEAMDMITTSGSKLDDNELPAIPAT
jgi:hypothetical protein